MTIKIRNVEDDDWPAIWEVLRTEAQRGTAFTYPSDMNEALGRAIWIQQGGGCNLAAIDGDDCLVGSAKVGPNQMGPGAHVATASFVVAPSARRQGVGRALAEAAVAWAIDSGFTSMQFNAVVETNTAAVALWQSLGFAIVGTVPRAFVQPNGGMVGLHIMHKEF